jgi:hypothetical protein
MDNAGFWRAPEEWPEDDPPLPGWIRDASGRWSAPDAGAPEPVVETRWDRGPAEPQPASTALAVIERETPSSNRRSRQARADRRAMFLVAGAIAGALLLLAGALILITQAGATQDPEQAEVAGPSVIYAAETEADFLAQRVEAAGARPAQAVTRLAALQPMPEFPDPSPVFDEAEWATPDTGCLDHTEQVLLARSAIDVKFADTLDCVPASGSWTDPYLGRAIRRTIDADVLLHVSPELAWAAGGFAWTAETRTAYVTDTAHPAVHQIVTAGAGHNPRSQGPADWRPADEGAWCAYAVDWVDVLHRWNLGISDADRSALGAMLESCDSPSSNGANPRTTSLEEPAPPAIALRTE